MPQIQSVYHKAQCVLHRRYIARARDNPRFTHSRRTCIDSSMELLRYQSILHQESRPGGRLRSKHRGSSLNTSDFLLAATIVCLDLYHGLQLQAAGRPSGDIYTWGRERRDEMLAAIKRSREIWEELRDESLEAYKAAGILGVMLAKLTYTPQNTDAGANAPMFEESDEKQNAAMTLGLLSSGMSPQNTAPTSFSETPFKNAESPLPQGTFGSLTDPMGLSSPFGMFGQAPDMQPLNLDWVRLSSMTSSYEFTNSFNRTRGIAISRTQLPITRTRCGQCSTYRNSLQHLLHSTRHHFRGAATCRWILSGREIVYQESSLRNPGLTSTLHSMSMGITTIPANPTNRANSNKMGEVQAQSNSACIVKSHPTC